VSAVHISSEAFRQPGYLPKEILGFASPLRNGFAFIEALVIDQPSRFSFR